MSRDAEFLERIVEYIDTHGHVKKTLVLNGRRCLAGAAIAVNEEMKIIRDTPRIFKGKMPPLYRKLYDLLDESPAALNDNPELEWSDIRDIVLNKAKDLRNNENSG